MTWATLLPELLEIILGKLTEATDHIRFHCTCWPWRSIARSHPMPASLPWLFLPHIRISANLQFYSISENRFYKMALSEMKGSRQIMGSASGLLLVVGKDQSSETLMINPFTRVRAHLPSIPFFGKTITWDYSGSVVLSYFGNLGVVAYCRSGEDCWSTKIDVNRTSIGPIHTIICKSGSFYLQPSRQSSVFYVLSAETLKLTQIIDHPYYNWDSQFVPTSDDTLLLLSSNIVDKSSKMYRPVLFKLNRQNSSWSKITDIGVHTSFDDDRFAFVFVARTHADLWKTTRFPASSKKCAETGSYNISTSVFGNFLPDLILESENYSSLPFWIQPSFSIT